MAYGNYREQSVTIDRRRYDWIEFLDAVKAHGPSEDGRDYKPSFHHATFDEALDMAYGNGWTPQTPNVADLLSFIETDLSETMENSFDWEFSTSGSRVNIPRYLAGDPNCMVKAFPMKVMKTGRVISLYVPATYPGSADTDQIIGRGIAIMALVEAFSMLQHPTEIVAGICNHAKRDRLKRSSFLITVQQATEPLDMGRIMFALAHPAFARQLGFAIKETHKQARTFGFFPEGGYGQSSREIRADDYADSADENVIVLPSIDADRFDWTNEPKVVEWIKAQLKRIEGE